MHCLETNDKPRRLDEQAMTAIEDLKPRKAIWLAFSDLFLDTDVTLFYDYIVNACASSDYSIDELATILKDEVAPACSFNLHEVTGEWAGFDADWLQNRIVKLIENKQTLFGKLRRMFDDSAMDEYVEEQWNVLSKRIRDVRNAV